MRALIIILVCFPIVFSACKKDKDNFVTGTVLEQGGCYSGSWLVRLDNPQPSKQFFLCAEPIQYPGNNCNNSVFISLPTELAIAGKKIKFIADKVEITCYSSNLVSKHITVKRIAAAD